MGPETVNILPGACHPTEYAPKITKNVQARMLHVIWNKVVVAVSNPLPDPRFRSPVERTVVVSLHDPRIPDVETDTDDPLGKATSKAVISPDESKWFVPFCAPGEYRNPATIVWESVVTQIRHLSVKTKDTNLIPV